MRIVNKRNARTAFAALAFRNWALSVWVSGCKGLPPRIPRSSGLNERGAVARVFLIGFDDGEEGTHACETGEKDEM